MKAQQNDDTRHHVSRRVMEYALSEASRRQCFSLGDFSRKFGVSRLTALNYLSRLQKRRLTYRAARGLYVFSARNPKAVERDEKARAIERLLAREFPLARFIVWSTRSLNPYYHNLVQRHFYFVEAEPEAAPYASEALNANGFQSVALDSRANAPVVRSLVKEPVFVLKTRNFLGMQEADDQPSLERIIVDLYFILTRYDVDFPLSELGRVFHNAMRNANLNYSHLVNLARRRKIDGEWREILYELLKLNPKSGIPGEYAGKRELPEKLRENVRMFVQSEE